MVTKTRKPAARKATANDGYILTVTINSRYFKTLKEANTQANTVINIKGGKLKSVVTKPKKLKAGYRFTIKTFFFTKNRTAANAAANDAKRAAPGSLVKIDKV